ncbi:hypothetical protein SAMN05446589_3853 [Streptomyces sp. OV198]|nr:hypothetical protein SAMN05446589_3853 [Streptomyces sp. OV198]
MAGGRERWRSLGWDGVALPVRLDAGRMKAELLAAVATRP